MYTIHANVWKSCELIQLFRTIAWEYCYIWYIKYKYVKQQQQQQQQREKEKKRKKRRHIKMMLAVCCEIHWAYLRCGYCASKLSTIYTWSSSDYEVKLLSLMLLLNHFTEFSSIHQFLQYTTMCYIKSLFMYVRVCKCGNASIHLD